MNWIKVSDRLPEKVYRYKFMNNWYLTEYEPNWSSARNDTKTEYILKSVADKKIGEAIAPIVEAWEYYEKVFNNDIARNDTNLAIEAIHKLKQAIKATVKRKEIETS